MKTTSENAISFENSTASQQYFHHLKRLEKQLFWHRILGVTVMVLLAAVVFAGFVKDEPKYLRVRGITVVDAQGKARILIGAPVNNEGRKRSDGKTASLVVLGPDGADRVILGEAPDPVLHGKTYPRIAPAYGMTIHDATGQERGGFSFLDNGRAVMALDRKNQDAVAMVVNDKSGFAGITMNYDMPFPKYKEALRMGTMADTVWMNMNDTSETERAVLRVQGKTKPEWQLGAKP
ncbi:MAG: hypothetical protein INR69_01330 [Mucilaginibacter polytrichastri]|nr:hypothetical protein [Mucilaginibacter polytrichastri]